MKTSVKTCAPILVFLLFMTGAGAKVIKVPKDRSTIQAGINSAANRDTVLVADGIYAGAGNRDLNFKGKPIIIKSENGAETTIIDCQNKGGGFSFANNEDTLSVLDGFTITHGNGFNGGAIYVENASPVIQNNIIIDNHAQNHGGGICCYNDASPIIRKNAIHRNSAPYQGGGIFCFNNSCPDITDNSIIENIGMYAGGIKGSNLTLIRNVIAKNSATYEGSGVSVGNDSKLINNTIIDNVGGIGGIFSSGTTVVINSIVWNNPGEVYANGGLISIGYSDIKGGWPGEGNIDMDPLFVDPENNNYHLKSTSPCINAGISSYVWESEPLINLSPEDYDGDAPDIGALEYTRPMALVNIPNLKSMPDTMISVPIRVQFSENGTCSSVELTAHFNSGDLEFFNVDLSNSLSGDAGWTYQFVESNGILKLAMAGAENISGEGVLLRLKYIIPETTSGLIPILLDSVLFDTGEIKTVSESGGIIVNYPPHIVRLSDFSFCNTQFYVMNLDTCVEDGNHSSECMTWQIVSMDDHLHVDVANRIAIFSAIDWEGPCDVMFRVTDSLGESDSITVKATVMAPVSVEDSKLCIPKRFALYQNQPNPFNPQTRISFDLPEKTDVHIAIYNLNGVKITEFSLGKKPAGHHTVIWDASSQASGTYIIRLETPGFVQIRKCVLVK